MVRVSKRNGRATASLIWETAFPRIEIATADISTVRRGSLHGKEQKFKGCGGRFRLQGQPTLSAKMRNMTQARPSKAINTYV
jgi:hypothetical protein